jgi:hypothetical protein
MTAVPVPLTTAGCNKNMRFGPGVFERGGEYGNNRFVTGKESFTQKQAQ